MTNTPTRRAFKAASIGANIAGSYLGYVLQSAFAGKTTREQKLKTTHTRVARKVRDEMLLMRGPAMKLGQTLSLQTGILPEETLAELATLQMQAPGMHPSLVRVQVKTSLGKEPEEIFETFSPKPFAAASLGQVHDATIRGGKRVAVKIQYPGIGETIESDFKWFRTITKPAQVSGHIPKEAIDEMERQIIAETDYKREADNIDFFKKKLAPLSFVEVPDVFREYSSDKVLTMTFVRGRHLEQFLASGPSQKVRNQLATNLFDLYYFQLLNLGAFHADPHWGNYLFNDDCTIGLVDFGCAKKLSKPALQYLKGVYLYSGSRHSAEFRRLLETNYENQGKKLPRAAYRALVDFAEEYRKVYPPEKDKQFVFDFSDKTFLTNYIRHATNLFRTKHVMTDYIFMARAEMGLYNTLHALKARVPTSDIVRKYL
ncbi:MAG TPA: AarF/ABC1/UbiB kinase family protein [Pyrinomonadaceae bacterium]|jgi:predicted unusual protein kinase regulating ubiquinone biosynthesis (AarF/ABC1/UbiB family)